MANLWSHYLSKLAALHSLLILFIWSGRSLVSARFLEQNQCWQADVSETPSAKDRFLFVQQVQNWRSFTLVQGHIHYPEMLYFLYFSSKTQMVSFKWTVYVFVIVKFDRGVPYLSTLLLTDSNHGLFNVFKN